MQPASGPLNNPRMTLYVRQDQLSASEVLRLICGEERGGGERKPDRKDRKYKDKMMVRENMWKEMRTVTQGNGWKEGV